MLIRKVINKIKNRKELSLSEIDRFDRFSVILRPNNKNYEEYYPSNNSFFPERHYILMMPSGVYFCRGLHWLPIWDYVIKSCADFLTINERYNMNGDIQVTISENKAEKIYKRIMSLHKNGELKRYQKEQSKEALKWNKRVYEILTDDGYSLNERGFFDLKRMIIFAEFCHISKGFRKPTEEERSFSSKVIY